MNEDIVFPEDNEKKFIKIAKKLEYDNIRFIYAYDKKLKIKELKEKINKLNQSIESDTSDKTDKTEFTCNFGLLASEKQIIDAKKICDFVMCNSFSNQRTVIEKLKPKIIFGLEKSDAKDFIFQKNSGLNHILARLAKENKVIIGHSFIDILLSSGKERSVLLGRIHQNIQLCKKYKVNNEIFSFAKDPYQMRSKKDMVNFFETI